MPAFVESLESREMLATTPLPPAPGLPFPEENAKTIYANQLGNATVVGKLAKPGEVDYYRVQFDDIGTLKPTVTGVAGIGVTLYSPLGRVVATPAQAAKSLNGFPVGPKRFYYMAVKSTSPKATGLYTLDMQGVPYGVIHDLRFRADRNINMHSGVLETPKDYDVFKFDTGTNRDWNIALFPVAQTDVALNVFDDEGTPVAGNFMKPLNKGGPGGREFFAGKLKPNSTYYVRITGVGTTAGNYEARAWWSSRPIVTVEATHSIASESGLKKGLFTITRSGTSLAQPLRVTFAVSGTALPGKDYRPLRGFAVIPAGSASTTMRVTALADKLVERQEYVQVKLQPLAPYSLDQRSRARVLINNVP